jgi:hypothetical protein
MTTQENIDKVLGRLVNISLTDKEIKAGLLKHGTPMVAECVEWRYSATAARNHIRASLLAWVEKNAWYGHGTKKLVDKAVSKLLARYKSSLRSALAEDRRDAKREQKWWLL